MLDASRGFQPAEQAKFILMAVQPGEANDSGLIEIGRRFEDQARKRHRRRENALVFVQASVVQRLDSGGSNGRDRVENAQQGIAVPRAVAADQLVEVKI